MNKTRATRLHDASVCMTHTEISRRLGVTRERVGQVLGRDGRDRHRLCNIQRRLDEHKKHWPKLWETCPFDITVAYYVNGSSRNRILLKSIAFIQRERWNLRKASLRDRYIIIRPHPDNTILVTKFGCLIERNKRKKSTMISPFGPTFRRLQPQWNVIEREAREAFCKIPD